MNAWMETTTIYWRSGGLLLIPIALVSLGIWTVFLRTWRTLGRAVRDSRPIETLVQNLDRQANPSDIIQALIAVPGDIALVIRMALQDVMQGATPMASFESRETEAARLLRRDLVILGALTTVAPLLGLLGTVMGMIETFDAVSTIGGDTGSRVAGGISRALITTQFGLVVALPGVFGVASLRKRLSHVCVRMKECRMPIVPMLERKQREVTA